MVALVVEQDAVLGLEDRAAVVADRLNRADAALVSLCRELLADQSWAGPGFRSPEHWLTVRVGLSPARAAEAMALARRHDELPAVAAGFEQGRLSLGQASTAARFAPVAHQQAVAELAENLTVPQLRRTLARYAFDVPDATGENQTAGTADAAHPAERGEAADVVKAQAPARLRFQHDPHGRVRFTFDAPADQGALVEQALREARDARFAGGDVFASLGDAMVEMASRSLATVESPHRADHYRVYVHLAADSPAGWVNGAGAVPPRLAALFACDGTVSPVIERQGRPVSVGRSRRIVPARTRRLIEDRDRGCRFPGCTATGHVEIHHLVPWSQGGGTDLDSNISLCPHHHRLLHTGAFSATGDPGLPAGSDSALAFATHAGLPIRPPEGPSEARSGVAPPDDTLREGAPLYRPPSGETVDRAWVSLPTDTSMQEMAAVAAARGRALRSVATEIAGAMHLAASDDPAPDGLDLDGLDLGGGWRLVADPPADLGGWLGAPG